MGHIFYLRDHNKQTRIIWDDQVHIVEWTIKLTLSMLKNNYIFRIASDMLVVPFSISVSVTSCLTRELLNYHWSMREKCYLCSKPMEILFCCNGLGMGHFVLDSADPSLCPKLACPGIIASLYLGLWTICREFCLCLQLLIIHTSSAFWIYSCCYF